MEDREPFFRHAVGQLAHTVGPVIPQGRAALDRQAVAGATAEGGEVGS
ncbi:MULTISPECIES: hypothetical protein [Streptomyces]|nr:MULTISPECIES: hypothetical protein [Streptomyces]